ncbi:HU family DNA-binding protein [Candidatus Parcubacteria bacterium]|jgi:DNA-binding protein HU-beta|nr:HU family DNA-binding protein [Candidatus Parcubacteria bacterium]
MNKAQLIETVAIKAGVSKKEAEDVLQALEDVVIERLKQGKEVTLTGFGTFSARTRNARMGVNPQNPKERIQIPTVIVPKFKAGKTLKDSLKNTQ